MENNTEINIEELQKSGYAGIDHKGDIVDRRAVPDAIPVPQDGDFEITEFKNTGSKKTKEVKSKKLISFFNKYAFSDAIIAYTFTEMAKQKKIIKDSVFATEIGISSSFFGAIKTGEAVPGLEIFYAICGWMGKMPNDFFNSEPQRENEDKQKVEVKKVRAYNKSNSYQLVLDIIKESSVELTTREIIAEYAKRSNSTMKEVRSFVDTTLYRFKNVVLNAEKRPGVQGSLYSYKKASE